MTSATCHAKCIYHVMPTPYILHTYLLSAACHAKCIYRDMPSAYIVTCQVHISWHAKCIYRAMPSTYIYRDMPSAYIVPCQVHISWHAKCIYCDMPSTYIVTCQVHISWHAKCIYCAILSEYIVHDYICGLLRAMTSGYIFHAYLLSSHVSVKCIYCPCISVICFLFFSDDGLCLCCPCCSHVSCEVHLAVSTVVHRIISLFTSFV